MIPPRIVFGWCLLMLEEGPRVEMSWVAGDVRGRPQGLLVGCVQ